MSSNYAKSINLDLLRISQGLTILRGLCLEKISSRTKIDPQLEASSYPFQTTHSLSFSVHFYQIRSNATFLYPAQKFGLFFSRLHIDIYISSKYLSPSPPSPQSCCQFHPTPTPTKIHKVSCVPAGLQLPK